MTYNYAPDSMHRKDSGSIVKFQQVLYKAATMVKQDSQSCERISLRERAKSSKKTTEWQT